MSKQNVIPLNKWPDLPDSAFPPKTLTQIDKNRKFLKIPSRLKYLELLISEDTKDIKEYGPLVESFRETA